MLTVQTITAGLVKIAPMRRGPTRKKVSLQNPFNIPDAPLVKDDRGRVASLPETVISASSDRSENTLTVPRRKGLQKSKSLPSTENLALTAVSTDVPIHHVNLNNSDDTGVPYSGLQLSATQASPHTHSDTCLETVDGGSTKVCEHAKKRRNKPRIEVVGTYSSVICGTDIKQWSVKVDMKEFVPCGNISVTADSHVVKIKVKVRTKGFFGGKDLSFKRFLKLKGDVIPSSLRTNADREGVLTVYFNERMAL